MHKTGRSKKDFPQKRKAFLYLFLTFIFRSAKSAVAVAEEAEKMLDFRCRREVLLHFVDGFMQLQTGTENGAVRFFQPASHFRGDIVSGNPHAVQSNHSCRIAVNDHERAYVLHNLGHAAHHGAGADFYELVDAAHAADDCVVFHDDVAGRAGKAGHDDVVSEIAVVCHMGVCLKHIMRADTGFAVFSRGTVDGDEFAEAVVVADDDCTVFVGKFQILRIFTDDGVRIYMIIFPHAYVSRNDRMGADNGAFADFTVGTDDGIGFDNHIFMKFGSRINNGRFMNLRLR